MKRAPAALLIPFVALAQGEALFDTPGEEDSAPAVAAPAPFSEWDGITQLFPRPVAASLSHAESAEFESHAENAESAELGSHAENAESAELESHAESAENAEPGGASSPSEPGSPVGGAAERSEAEGVIQHSAFSIQHSSLPSLSFVSEFPLPDSAPEGLSGIAWTSNPGNPHFVDPDPFGREGGPGPRFDICTPDSYVLCEDSGAWLDFAEIGIDRASGAITSAVFRVRERAYFYFGEPPEAADFEAIAYAPSRHNYTHFQLYVSDEAHPHIWQDRLDPCTLGVIALPSPIVRLDLPDALRAHRPNKGVEAMCLSPDDRALWLANEDALPEDGPVATTEHGALVRLWRMDAIAGTSEAQLRRSRAQGGAGPVEPAWWFYELDPAAGEKFPHLPDPFNGLAELCALPDGRLLALERAYGLRTRGPDDPRASLIAISIYLVDPLSSAARTAAAERPPVLAKTLLWRGLTGRANYEGMTLGPELADGSRALILVSDGDVTRKGAFAFPWSKRLLSFRLRLPDAP